MWVAGLYFVFLLLEDVIVAYYSTDAASQDQEINFKAAYDMFRKEAAKALDKDITVRQINGNNKLQYLFNISTTTAGTPQKKWHIKRSTRKQYEIVNMLWRKTKIFMDEDNIYTTTPAYIRNLTKIMSRRFQKDSIKLTTTSASPITTTPSNIEFYYLDDTRDHSSEKKCAEPNCKRSAKTFSQNAKPTSKSSFFVFHIKGPYVKLQLIKENNTISRKTKSVNEPKKNTITSISMKITQVTMKPKSSKLKFINEVDNSHGVISRDDQLLYNVTLAVPMEIKTSLNLDHLNDSIVSNNDNNDNESTSIYDKIKFFELYDQNTRPPNTKDVNTPNGPSVDYNDDSLNINNQKILLEHVDQGSHDHEQAKHSKKHITEPFQKGYKLCNQTVAKETTKSSSRLINVFLKKQDNEFVVSDKNVSSFVHSMSSNNNKVFSYVYENASWSEYPFAAVYIYEPSQVQCDVAGISAHWLVASGSCLSRVNKDHNGEGRSAFVAYCGEQWWHPERVAYVKYSLIHPSYHPRDMTRRNLYNIGVIQVVTSMVSACSGWAPVSLMSHHVGADPQGSWASAVGWGVDRFDTSSGAADLPRTLLKVYKGLVYFDSCPGSVGYSKAKRLDEGGGVENVHCVSLPPYAGEHRDPVHGGLLLVAGKLIALYLQEERRPWGEQSAQYTGVWRLMPWVMEVAKEPEERNTFIFDI